MALTAIHPGEHLAEELQALDMSAAELARKINVPTNRVTQIVNGTRSITGYTALRLAHCSTFLLQVGDVNLSAIFQLRGKLFFKPQQVESPSLVAKPQKALIILICGVEQPGSSLGS
jgi:addiction module HigA family antidote